MLNVCSPQPVHGEGESAAPPRGQRQDPPGPEGWSRTSCFLLPASSDWTVCPGLQVTGSGPALASSTSSGSAGAPAPAGGALQTSWGGGAVKHQSEFKYCFREVKEGQVRGLQGPNAAASAHPGRSGPFTPPEGSNLRF